MTYLSRREGMPPRLRTSPLLSGTLGVHLAYPVHYACLRRCPGTGVPRCLGVARSASSPIAEQTLGSSLSPGLRVTFGWVTCRARAAPVPGLWTTGFLPPCDVRALFWGLPSPGSSLFWVLALVRVQVWVSACQLLAPAGARGLCGWRSAAPWSRLLGLRSMYVCLGAGCGAGGGYEGRGVAPFPPLSAGTWVGTLPPPSVSAASPICSDFQTFCPDWLHFGHFLCFGGIAASQLSHRIFPIYF